MKGYIRVLGSGIDAPTALVLMMENKRYLFNCGEGEYWKGVVVVSTE